MLCLTNNIVLAEVMIRQALILLLEPLALLIIMSLINSMFFVDYATQPPEHIPINLGFLT